MLDIQVIEMSIWNQTASLFRPELHLKCSSKFSCFIYRFGLCADRSGITVAILYVANFVQKLVFFLDASKDLLITFFLGIQNLAMQEIQNRSSLFHHVSNFCPTFLWIALFTKCWVVSNLLSSSWRDTVGRAVKEWVWVPHPNLYWASSSWRAYKCIHGIFAPYRLTESQLFSINFCENKLTSSEAFSQRLMKGVWANKSCRALT